MRWTKYERAAIAHALVAAGLGDVGARRLLQAINLAHAGNLGPFAFHSPAGAGSGRGIERIAAERRRQVEEEGWTPDHDDQHTLATLPWVAAMYAVEVANRIREHYPGCRILPLRVVVIKPTGPEEVWPWDGESDKRKRYSEDRLLEIAGALIAAELDRRERAKQS